jgi:hypothetical protein
MSQSRKQLKEYDGSDGTWLTWNQHFKGHFSALKTGSQWQVLLGYFLEGSNPHEDGRMTITTMLEAQVQRSCLANGHSVGMVDQTGTAVYATVENPQDTSEGEEIYKARCDEWDTVTEHV